MKIFIATDITVVNHDGRIYAAEQYSNIFARYFENFGKIMLYCRTEENANTNALVDITDLLDKVIKVTSFKNILLGKIPSEVTPSMSNCDLVIGRCPSFSSIQAMKCAKKLGKPYFAESMGCAWDAYWNHSIVGKMIAPYMFFKMKSVVKNADYALYVTSEFLQNRYPCKNESVGVSDVLITHIDEQIKDKRLERIERFDGKEITLMTTAALNVRYKGQEYVIKAIPGLNKKGIRVKYLLVGGGDDSYLRSVAKKCKVEDQVVFVGRQPLSKVFELLGEADIYIQPSLQEGLPRSVIEAMSRACPCIGAKTAGIPELISPECVVRRKSVKDIINAVITVTDKKKMSELASINFEKSKEFHDSVLAERRNAYYEKVKNELKG